MTPKKCRQEKEYLPVIAKAYSCKVMFDDIMFIEKAEGYIYIHRDKRKERSSQRMDEVIEYLKDYPSFFTCHSKLVINLDHVMRMENGYIWFSNDETAYLGAHNFAKARKRVNEYIAR